MTDSDCVQRFASAKTQSRLLHAIVDTARIEASRVDVSPESEWLQLSIISPKPGASMKPHVHNARAANTRERLPQEAWFVIAGSMSVRLYDEDKQLLHETTLRAGQLLVTFHGGHAFHSVEAGTRFMECKNGPYEGRDYTAFEEGVSEASSS